MTVRRIVISSSSASRLEEALRHFRSLAGRTEWVVIAHTRGAADDFARAAAAGGGGILGVHRLTLTQLAAVLASEGIARVGLAPVSRLGLEAIAARSVYACRAERKLAYFDPVADTPGFPRALAATFSELRLRGVSARSFARAGAPGKDLSRLFTRYQEELAERSLADLAMLYRLATDVAEHRLLGLPLVLLDCVVDSLAAEQCLAAVARRSPDVCATVPAGDVETLRALERLLGVGPHDLDAAPPGTTLDRVRRYIFVPQMPPGDRADPSLEFFSAPGEGLEAVEIARRILRLAGKGVPFDRIAVLLRHPADYVPLLEDAFRRAGIPSYFSRGAVRPDPAGRAFLALLACAAEGLTASRFAEYLSLGQVPSGESSPDWVPPQDEALAALKMFPEPPPEAAPPEAPEDERSPVVSGTLRTPFEWEELLVDAAVIGGHDRWSRRLRGLENQYRLQLSQLEAEGDPRREHLERQIERLGHLQRFALPVIEFLSLLPSSALWKVWLDRLAQLAGMTLRQPDSVLSVLAELEPMEEVGPVTLDEVRSVLTETLTFLRREPPQRRYGRVFAGAIDEARGRSFDVVFLPGLAEGLFPRRASEDPLLLDEHRVKLAAGLLTQDDRVTRERLLLRVAAGAARSRLVVSYPRMDVAIGRPRVPSFYLLEIWRAAEGRLPDLREMEARAGHAAPAQLGWPAPQQTGDAIDDAEYDLAYLNRSFHLPATEARGAGRYLLRTNLHLDRSLRARWLRWQKKSWSSADGIVNPGPEASAILARHSLRERSYSPTALQQYAACPYRFLLYAVHYLRPREEAVAIEQLDPLTRGAILHQVQLELFRDLQSAGLLPVEEESLPRIYDFADQVLNRVADRHREDLAPAIPSVWTGGIEEIRVDLRNWLRELVPLHAEWRPIHFEFAFGLPRGAERDPESREEPAVVLDGYKLRGSIDLVERHRNFDILRVTDHKTGKAPEPPPRWIGKGEILQPLLYGLAAEKILGRAVDAGVLYFATQRGNFTRITIPLDQNARLRAQQVLETIDQAVTGGFLPAAPREDACKWCDYAAVCGPYEERRTRGKERGSLDPLLSIRSTP